VYSSFTGRPNTVTLEMKSKNPEIKFTEKEIIKSCGQLSGFYERNDKTYIDVYYKNYQVVKDQLKELVDLEIATQI